MKIFSTHKERVGRSEAFDFFVDRLGRYDIFIGEKPDKGGRGYVKGEFRKSQKG